jgi:hypothetical protein
MMLEPLLAQVSPCRIRRHYQSDLLHPEQAFNFFLPLNRISNVFESFEINQTIQFLSSREIRSAALFVLAYSPDQIVRHARIERLGAAARDVNEVDLGIAKMHRSFASLRMTTSLN